MIIAGAGGFAKEVLQVFHDLGSINGIAFFDDVDENGPNILFSQFPVLKNEEQVKAHFRTYGSEFTIGVGKPILRQQFFKKMQSFGGILSSSISPSASIGNYDVHIGLGCNIFSGAVFSNSSSMGKCGLVYYNSIITHNCHLEDFVEISPNVSLLGGVKIKSYTQIGAGSVILPHVTVGENVVVGAGSIVTKDIPNNSIAYGVPAKVVKTLPPL